MDDWLAEHEGEEGVPEGAASRTTSGIGVFYYEGPVAEQAIKASVPLLTK
jgi:hypothetical protein